MGILRLNSKRNKDFVSQRLPALFLWGNRSYSFEKKRKNFLKMMFHLLKTGDNKYNKRSKKVKDKLTEKRKDDYGEAERQY